MSRYNLPHEAVVGIAPLGTASPQTIQALAAEFSANLDISFSFADGVARLVHRSLNVPGTDADKKALADAIVGIHILKQALGKSAAEVAHDVAEAIRLNTSANLSEDQLGAFAENATTLLNVVPLQASAKSLALRGDHNHIFLRSRIFTDIRPVFADDLNSPLLASLLTHTVKISFRSNGQQESVFFVADAEDLKQLKKDISRALDKAQAISKLLNRESFGPALDQEDE